VVESFLLEKELDGGVEHGVLLEAVMPSNVSPAFTNGAMMGRTRGRTRSSRRGSEGV